MINCLVVDDELIARKGIEKYIRQIPFLEVAGSVRTTGEALDHLDKKIDLMILDIRMPQQTGLEFLKTVPEPPVTIIITAYPEYALQGFELDVIDYIVKPASYERFVKACTKAKDYIELRRRDSRYEENVDYLFLKANGKIERIFFDDILYIEAKENYSHVFTENGNYFTLVGLGNMEEMLHKQKFMRVHRSFIVSLSKIVCLDGNVVQIAGSKIPVSRRVRNELKDRLLKD
jgi:DNA-binding LytR/AlgR family response regulator